MYLTDKRLFFLIYKELLQISEKDNPIEKCTKCTNREFTGKKKYR